MRNKVNMERKIGEIFENNGEWYQCVEGTGCYQCAFNQDEVTCLADNPHCTSRSDRKDVIFKKLEKYGGFIKDNIRGEICQPYTIFDIDRANSRDDRVQFSESKSDFVFIVTKQNQENMEEKNNGNTPLNVLTDKYVNGDICYDDFEKEVKALYSCKEEIKPTLKDFDLEAAKAGKPVCTRDGRKARIICFDAKDTQPIIGLYEKNIDGRVRECLCSYNTDGRIYDGQDTGYDLMMLPEKKEGWVNIYDDMVIYESEEEARIGIATARDYIATTKIEWEE